MACLAHKRSPLCALTLRFLGRLKVDARWPWSIFR